MPLSPREFVETIVRANLEKFDAHNGDLRHAFNAVAAIDALAAHLFHWCCENRRDEVAGIDNDSQYRKLLAGRNEDFRILRDAAKAFKHAKLDQGNPDPSSAGAVFVASLTWKEPARQVVVRTHSGEIHAVDELATGATDFLLQEMERLGAL